MLFSTIGQFPVFLWMIAAGFIIGIWYALLAALRKLLQAGFWLSLACDLAFGAGAAAIFLAFLITANYGKFRFFTLLGVLIGIILFAGCILPPAKALLNRLRGAMCRICCRIKQNRLIKVIFR
jgi:spore cortex biosynthesis protein YabQ